MREGDCELQRLTNNEMKAQFRKSFLLFTVKKSLVPNHKTLPIQKLTQRKNGAWQQLQNNKQKNVNYYFFYTRRAKIFVYLDGTKLGAQAKLEVSN